MKRFLALDQKLPKNEPIYLVIYSPGGSINAGLELIDFVGSIDRPIHTISIFAASMAFTIHQLIPNKRFVFEFGTLMAHKARGGFKGEFPGQIDSQYAFWKKRLDGIDRRIIEKIGGLDLADWKKMYENEMWLNGFNAVQKGFSDQLANFVCDDTLRGTRLETIIIFPYKFMVEWSKCPLIPNPLSVKITYGNKIINDIKSLETVKRHFNFKSWSSEQIKNVNGVRK